MQDGGSGVQSIKNQGLSKQPRSSPHSDVLLLRPCCAPALLLGVPSLPAGMAELVLHLFLASLHHFQVIPCPCG